MERFFLAVIISALMLLIASMSLLVDSQSAIGLLAAAAEG